MAHPNLTDPTTWTVSGKTSDGKSILDNPGNGLPCVRAWGRLWAVETYEKERVRRIKDAGIEMLAALECAAAQLEADHDPKAAAEMFGGEPDPARAMNINRYDVSEMCRVAIAKARGEG